MLYFESPCGLVKIHCTTRKNIQRYFAPKHLIGDLLSNLTFFNLCSNLKENYKCIRMAARTPLYNNQLYNIVGYLYSFRTLSVQ